MYEAFHSEAGRCGGEAEESATVSRATDQGPLIDTKALAKVEEHIADAVAKGGQIAYGGKRHALGRHLLPADGLTERYARHAGRP